VFGSLIRRNIRLAEAPSFGQSIFDYAPQSHGAEDYRALAEEVTRQTTEDVCDPQVAQSGR
jgi:chromosome partitioning protein